MSAYIDLNPVRAGMVKDPEEYRWSSDGEAVGGGAKGENETFLRELSMAERLGHRMRCFTSGAVIGSRAFVNEVFSLARERFAEKRKDGARKMKVLPKEANDLHWSMRDLRNPLA